VATKPRTKMTQENRAKQFMPFAALTGLEAALEAVEKVTVPKKELSEEMLAELDEKIHVLKKGDMATVIFYEKGEYLKLTGIVARIDESAGILQIVNKKIRFADLTEILTAEEVENEYGR